MPIVTAEGQSFVIALRLPSAGAEWSIHTDTARLVHGHSVFMGETVERAFEYQKTVTIGDAALENVQRAADAPPVTGGESTQYFLFKVLDAPYQTLAPGSSSVLTFTRHVPDRQAMTTLAFTVKLELNHYIC